MRLRIYIGTIVLGGWLFANNVIFAQDIHFSAVEYAPLTLNPAFAGANNDVQINVNYRNQWNAVTEPYKTIATGADVRIKNKKSHKSKGIFALGIDFYNDNAGSNKITSNNVGLTAAYHLKMKGGHYLGLGLQGSYGNRSIELTNSRWGNQYDGVDWNPTIASGEAIGTPSFSYFDASAGLVYTWKEQNRSPKRGGTTLQFGVATYHFNQPNYSFMGDKSERLKMRITAFAMAQIGLKDQKMAIEPQLITQFQNSLMEILLGTDVRFFIGESNSNNKLNMSLTAGLFWRNNDALLTKVSLRIFGFDIGMVYDINVFNNLQYASKFRGAFELFLSYKLNYEIEVSRARF